MKRISIDHPPEPEFEDVLSSVEWCRARDARLLDLAREHARGGAFAVSTSIGYKLVTREPSDNLWRCTSYDGDGFPVGHICERKWEAVAIDAMRSANAFVSSIPTAPYEQGTKDELLERIANGIEGKYTSLTLLLAHGVDHPTIFDARLAHVVKQDALYSAAIAEGNDATAREILRKCARARNFTARLYHGTDARHTRFDGGLCLTDNKAAAQAYAGSRSAETFLDRLSGTAEGEELQQILAEIMDDAGARSLRDLDVDTIEDVIDANGLDIDLTAMPVGTVMDLYVNEGKVLDLTELGSECGDVPALCRHFTAQGLIEWDWDALDDEMQQEVLIDYQGKALYVFLEGEGVLAKAFERYNTVKYEDQAMGCTSTHTTWAVKSHTQVRSAELVEWDTDGTLILPSGRFVGSGQDIRGHLKRPALQQELAWSADECPEQVTPSSAITI